ncbi:MFS-type transporter SLC18B1-like isoform X5 [Mauremys mutica]|uniref:MFS-type transporter SLC18B1-like isoform X5 n=1 Tax=Mauremys mutica TaxID=74926 RepID=UPI001D15E7FB|nr:MFS-type transporter SLC18B1-like isoform X5 [Mauremys mutica]XP_044867074.1 MFS-type transporter SLC18B1-like isoform X5 [Mauremys mutica]
MADQKFPVKSQADLPEISSSQWQQQAEKKGASDTVVGLIFGCFALSNFLTSLIVGNYLVQIGAKFTFVAGMFVSGCITILFGMLDRAPDGPIFIGLCFLVRAMDATGFAAAATASFSILAKAFPNNIATVMGSLETFTGLGLVLGPPLGGFLFQSFGYEVPFTVLGCIVLILVPLNMYLLPKYDALATKDSFWMLVTLPKVVFLCFTRFSLSACLGFLEPTMSLFVLEKFKLPAGYVGLVFLALALSYSLSAPLLGLLSDKMPYLRKWLLVFGGLLTALSFFLLGPAPILHIESKLWMFVLTLVLYGFSFGMTCIPLFPEILSCAYENGFEQGLSTLGLVSGLCGAMWSLGGFVGPTLGGFLNERLGFEWAAAIQGGWALLSGLAIGIFYILEASQRRRSSLQTPPGTNEERVHLLASEM